MSAKNILVDTDVLIEFLRGKEKAKILLEEASNHAKLFCSVVTIAEILAGMRLSEESATEALLSSLNSLPVTENIARTAGLLRKSIRGRQIMLPDCLIGATALIHDCRLLTFNKKDYPHSQISFFPSN